MAGRKPDYAVKLPVENVWHKLGVAWRSENNGTINVVLDVGVPMTLIPGTKLVLVPQEEQGS